MSYDGTNCIVVGGDVRVGVRGIYWVSDCDSMNFKKGDKVRNKITGVIDVVKSVPGMNEYDSMEFGLAEEGMVLEKASWEFQKEWELYSDRSAEVDNRLARARELLDEVKSLIDEYEKDHS
jgi:hypothetical protein